MPTNRIDHRIAVALVSAVGLLLALGVQAGLSAAATDTSDAGTSGFLQGKVRIHLRGHMKGPQFAAFGRGRFIAAGAITDRGGFVDEFRGIHPPAEPHLRTLRGAKGTIRIEVDRDGRWRITQGTKAYIGLRGRGTEQGQYRFVGIDAMMIGAVWR